MVPVMLRILQLLLMLLSTAGILAGIFMMGNGFKGDPVNPDLGAQGFLVTLGALCLFPSRQHILYRLWKSRRSGAPNAAPPEPVKPVATARPAAVMIDRIGRNPKLYDGRVRLDFPVPPPDLGRATSWIGGLPKLPADAKWPVNRGGPFLFLAQIAMADLPRNIWGGHAPRTGSLAFFVENEGNFRRVSVLHVDGHLAERAYPGLVLGDINFPRLRSSLDQTQRAVAPTSDEVALTKWPVHITPVDAGTRLPVPYFKYGDPDNAATRLQKTLSLANPDFAPYSWDVLIALVSVLVGALNGSVQDERRMGLVSDLHLESQADRTAAAKALGTRRDALRKRAMTTAFSAAEWDEIVTFLSGIHVRQIKAVGKNRGTGKADYALLPPEPVLNLVPLGKYYSVFEYLSRQVYSVDPGRLPPPVRAALEPIWQHDAAYEVASMGGQIDLAGYVTAARGDLVCLLEMPCSELVGTSWHDLSSFGVFIAPEDLVAGRFDLAFGEVTES